MAAPVKFEFGYGAYRHPPGAVEFSFMRDLVESPAEQPLHVNCRWDLTGWLVATGFADCHAQAGALMNAYGSNGGDIGLYANGQPTHLFVANSSTLSGNRVIRPPSFPSNRDASYITQLPFAITVEGQQPAVPTNSLVITKWEEVLDFEGGGSLYGYLETLIGDPHPQRRKEKTIFRAVQSGTAYGLNFRPTIPAPLWPSYQTKRPAVRKISPQRRGNGFDQEWGITWRYEFEADVPLSGEPNTWGGF